jgi:Trk-type K+ transport system membrane component
MDPDIRRIFAGLTPPLNPWYGGYWLAWSAFCDSGFTPIQNSVIPFLQSSGFLIFLSVFMLTGNVGFPALFRGMLELMYLMQLEVRTRNVVICNVLGGFSSSSIQLAISTRIGLVGPFHTCERIRATTTSCCSPPIM